MKKLISISICLCLMLTFLAGCGFNLSTDYYENAEKYTVGDGDISDKVENIDISWSSGEVNLVYYDGENVRISESCSKELPEDQKVHWYLDGTTLIIKNAKSGVIFSTQNYKKILTVSLPEDYTAEKIEISASSAHIKTDELNADKMEISSSSGEIELKTGTCDIINISTSSGKIGLEADEVRKVGIDTSSGAVNVKISTCDELEIDSSSGKIKADTSTIRKAEVETSSGDVKFYARESLSQMDIESSSGDVKIYLPETFGFTVRTDTASGTFESGVPLTTSGGKHVFGDGSAQIDVDTSSGDIYIFKIEE